MMIELDIKRVRHGLRAGLIPLLAIVCSFGVAKAAAQVDAGLSGQVSEALASPPEQLSTPVLAELERAWSEVSVPLLERLIPSANEGPTAQVWSGRLAEQPYVHFKAGSARTAAEAPAEEKVTFVVFAGADPQDVTREFASWFEPVRDGDYFIESFPLGVDRAAYSNMTDDGTRMVYWFEGPVFVEVRGTGDVQNFARRVDSASRNAGLYEFHDSLMTGGGEASGVVAGESSSGDASAGTSFDVPEVRGAESVEAGDAAGDPAVDMAGNPEGDASGYPAAEATGEVAGDPAGEVRPIVSEGIPNATVATGVEADPVIIERPAGQADEQVDALHEAVRQGQLDVAASLIQQDVNVEGRDAVGRTPLLKAAAWGTPEMVMLLLEAGAEVNVRQTGSPQDYDYGSTPIMKAADRGAQEIVQALIDAGADVNAVDRFDRTALHLAVGKGHREVAGQLLRAGARVNAQANSAELPPQFQGLSPLMNAVMSEQVPMVELLVQAGGDPNLATAEGKTSFDLAEERRNETILALLRSAGPAPTPVEQAAEIAQAEPGSVTPIEYDPAIDGGGGTFGAETDEAAAEQAVVTGDLEYAEAGPEVDAGDDAEMDAGGDAAPEGTVAAAIEEQIGEAPDPAMVSGAGDATTPTEGWAEAGVSAPAVILTEIPRLESAETFGGSGSAANGDPAAWGGTEGFPDESPSTFGEEPGAQAASEEFAPLPVQSSGWPVPVASPAEESAPTESGWGGEAEAERSRPGAGAESWGAPAGDETLGGVVKDAESVRAWKERLWLAWKRLNVDINDNPDASILRAIITGWDGNFSPDATGPVAYEYWRKAISRIVPQVTAGEPYPPEWLTDQILIDALAPAAEGLQRDYGTTEVPLRRRYPD